MDINRVRPGDHALIGACHEVHVAANEADSPQTPPMSSRLFAALIGSGWIGDPRETWLTADGDAYCALELPERENRHLAMLELAVRPERRRRGIGTAVLNFATERALRLGRSLISTSALEGSAGEEFARSAGYKRGLAEIRRVLRVGEVPPAVATPGYSIVSWTGATPEDMLGQVAVLSAAIEDAPRDPGWEPELWDSERVRRTDRRVATSGLRYYSVAAMADSGDMAALTQVGVDPGQPEWGQQELTAVTRPHRGHRLGMAVKVAMLGLLARAEPRLVWILTWNAEENKHMAGINEELGFEVLGRPWRSLEREI